MGKEMIECPSGFVVLGQGFYLAPRSANFKIALQSDLANSVASLESAKVSLVEGLGAKVDDLQIRLDEACRFYFHKAGPAKAVS